PRLPERWNRLSFKLAWRGQRILVILEPERITFTLTEGDTPVKVSVRGVDVTVWPGEPSVVELSDQGPDLGAFSGLSAGMLPRETDTYAGQFREPTLHTTPVPTLPPTSSGGAAGR